MNIISVIIEIRSIYLADNKVTLIYSKSVWFGVVIKPSIYYDTNFLCYIVEINFNLVYKFQWQFETSGLKNLL